MKVYVAGLCSPGRIRPGLRRARNERLPENYDCRMQPPIARVASLRGTDECVRPYTKDLEN